MVQHIVIFRLRDDIAPAEKARVMQQFKSAIEALPAVISSIRHIHVGLNINADEACDICLNSSFDTLEEVRAYAAHPAHLAAAGALKPYVAARSCVDYSAD
jgi:hemoglobin-like flavoprotein